MRVARLSMPALLQETLIASAAYVGAFLVTFGVLTPVQNLFFPAFPSYASLLFLPHGVRVLAAWMLGWRAVPALAPGMLLMFLYVVGTQAFQPLRLAAMIIALVVAPATFRALALAGHDLAPRAGRVPCWPCVMGAGILVSLLGAGLVNLVLGNGPVDYLAYMIGDVFGLFFLMMILMFVFRAVRARGG